MRQPSNSIRAVGPPMWVMVTAVMAAPSGCRQHTSRASSGGDERPHADRAHVDLLVEELDVLAVLEQAQRGDHRAVVIVGGHGDASLRPGGIGVDELAHLAVAERV